MTESSFTVRRAKPNDADAIATVHVAAWQTTYAGIVDRAYIDSLSVQERSTAWARRLADRTSGAPDIFVALSDDHRVVGFISGGPIRVALADFDAELHAIYLLQPFQRLGLGQHLARCWARAALDRGLQAGVVRVLARNPACVFYERLGATLMRETSLVIGGEPYPERWYGWRTLRDLAA